MDVNLQHAVINYHSLVFFPFDKNTPEIKRKWYKKLRRKIISHINTDMNFFEFYKVLKSVEKQGFGFYIKPMRFEEKKSDSEKIVFQQVEVGLRFMLGKEFRTVPDVGFGPITLTENLKENKSKLIKPEEIVQISNKLIMDAIKVIDKQLYHHIVQEICNYWYKKLKSIENNYLFELLSEVLEEYGVCKIDYCIGGFHDDRVCLEKDENNWIVYIGERGGKQNIKRYQFCIEACCDLLGRISESDEMCYELKKLLIKKLKKCDSAAIAGGIKLNFIE